MSRELEVTCRVDLRTCSDRFLDHLSANAEASLVLNDEDSANAEDLLCMFLGTMRRGGIDS